jgi:hypothetical protein
MSDTNNNFDDLKRLLKLKRHEIPPPGYFNHLSGDVISRIRAGESGGPSSIFEQLHADSPFLGNLMRLFESKPGLIGGLATSVCLFLLVAVVLADNSEPAASPMAPQIAAQGAPDSAPAMAPTLVASDGGITVNTNPVSSLQPVATLFGSPQNPLFQSVNFMPANQ